MQTTSRDKVAQAKSAAAPPTPQLLGPTVSRFCDDAPKYVEAVFKAGALPMLDAVSVHGYGEWPEGWVAEAARLQTMMSKYSTSPPPVVLGKTWEACLLWSAKMRTVQGRKDALRVGVVSPISMRSPYPSGSAVASASS